MTVHFTLGGKRWFGTEKGMLLHSWLPYGRWRCADGREVLFNRFYEPIWERTGRVVRHGHLPERQIIAPASGLWRCASRACATGRRAPTFRRASASRRQSCRPTPGVRRASIR